MPSKSKEKKKKKKSNGPKSRDPHWLYQESVQSPDVNIDFIERVYKRKNGRLPNSLKEDFCGTAFMSAEWVRRRANNEAIGVDIDAPTLKWGTQHNIAPLGEGAARVTLLEADVRSVHTPQVDVVAAFNFSYFIFKDAPALREYFQSVRGSLAENGIFVLDIFGGWEAQMEVKDKTRYKGFTYVWEQERYNPIDNNAIYSIHFKFHAGGGIRRAYRYNWRLWTIPEVRDALHEAGFTSCDIYWEGTDPKTNEGNGVFRKVKRAENCPGWNALIVAS
jgi:SAM-dependent methyltransferase